MSGMTERVIQWLWFVQDGSWCLLWAPVVQAQVRLSLHVVLVIEGEVPDFIQTSFESLRLMRLFAKFLFPFILNPGLDALSRPVVGAIAVRVPHPLAHDCKYTVVLDVPLT